MTNYRSALEKARGVIVNNKLLIHQSQCPQLVYTLRQPLHQLLKSPVMKALVWVVTALEDEAGNGVPGDSAAKPWYANRDRQPA